MDDLVKTMEKDSNTPWEDQAAPSLGATRIPEDLRNGHKEEEAIEAESDKRASMEEEFVDAPTSPLEKPKDWGDVNDEID